MPRGIPNEQKQTDDRKSITITMLVDDFKKLERLANEQYRTPQLQAGFLLKQVLAKVTGYEVDETAHKILERARARANGEG